ncbi:MAG TPA: CopG family antitoxin [Thermoanaerobaculia bacterium]
MKTRKKIPTFKDENAKREFWTKADSTDYIDWSQAERIVPSNFRPKLAETMKAKRKGRSGESASASGKRSE